MKERRITHNLNSPQSNYRIATDDIGLVISSDFVTLKFILSLKNYRLGAVQPLFGSFIWIIYYTNNYELKLLKDFTIYS